MKITKTKKGYTCVVYLGVDEEGKSLSKRFTAPTKEDLKKAVNEYQYQYDMAKARKISLGMTLQDAFRDYIESREHLLSPASVKRYRGIMRNDFQDLMLQDIKKIKKQDVQKAVNGMAQQQSPKTVRDKVALFNSVMKEYRGFAFDLYLPQKEKKDLYIPTREEVDKLLEFEKGSKWEVPILLAALCGLRRSEIAALTWEDVDLEEGTIRINKALGVTDGEGYRLKAPKTYAGYRKAEIPERVKIVLQRLSEERKPITELNIQTMSNKFPHELEKAGLHRFRFHDLRHYFASSLLALGVPDLYVIKIIGHSTTSMLEHYQHVLSDEDRKFRDLIRENL